VKLICIGLQQFSVTVSRGVGNASQYCCHFFACCRRGFLERNK